MQSPSLVSLVLAAGRGGGGAGLKQLQACLDRIKASGEIPTLLGDDRLSCRQIIPAIGPQIRAWPTEPILPNLEVFRDSPQPLKLGSMPQQFHTSSKFSCFVMVELTSAACYFTKGRSTALHNTVAPLKGPANFGALWPQCGAQTVSGALLQKKKRGETPVLCAMMITTVPLCLLSKGERNIVQFG